MKKSTSTRLAVRTQTLRLLTSATLDSVVGGGVPPIQNGFIMKDTIIIRTGG